jgi:hypothetical protein
MFEDIIVLDDIIVSNVTFLPVAEEELIQF